MQPTFVQFIKALLDSAHRPEIGLDITDDDASALLTNQQWAKDYYQQWTALHAEPAKITPPRVEPTVQHDDVPEMAAHDLDEIHIVLAEPSPSTEWPTITREAERDAPRVMPSTAPLRQRPATPPAEPAKKQSIGRWVISLVVAAAFIAAAVWAVPQVIALINETTRDDTSLAPMPTVAAAPNATPADEKPTAAPLAPLERMSAAEQQALATVPLNAAEQVLADGMKAAYGNDSSEELAGSGIVPAEEILAIDRGLLLVAATVCDELAPIVDEGRDVRSPAFFGPYATQFGASSGLDVQSNAVLVDTIFTACGQ